MARFRKCTGAHIAKPDPDTKIILKECARICGKIGHMFVWGFQQHLDTPAMRDHCICFTETTNEDGPGRCIDQDPIPGEGDLYRLVEGM